MKPIITKTIGNQTYRIQEKLIEPIMKGLGVTQDEAIIIYLEDEKKLINAEQEALCKKVKESGIMRSIHGATSAEVIEKKMNNNSDKKPTQKGDPSKEKIIADITELLSTFCENVTVTNKAKVIEFSYNDNNYKLDLIKRTKKKE